MTTAVMDREEIVEAAREFVIADLFCGAGGSSTGAKKAVEEIGGTMNLAAVNHWPVAVETHQKNHPAAQHYVEDVERADPETIVPKGYLDILMASPECRFYSRARGGKPTHDQGRMNPWVVMKWLTSLDVRTMLVENVPEFVDWGPLLTNQKPDPKRKGMYFEEWVRAIWGLGYTAEWRMLNAADHGEATSRTRFFLIARNDGRPIKWPEASHSKRGGEGLEGSIQKWRGAREIIDWTNSGRSLLDDPKYLKRPLSIKTRRRIAKGLQKFGGPMAPLYIRLLDLPEFQDMELPGSTALTPFIINRHGENGSLRCHDTNNPTPTVTGRGAGYLITPALETAEMEMAGTEREETETSGLETSGLETRGLETDSGSARPFVLPHQRGRSSAKSTEEPVPAVTTRGPGYLVKPDIIATEAQPFTCANRNGNAPREVDDPLAGITTTSPGGGLFLVKPDIIVSEDTEILVSEDTGEQITARQIAEEQDNEEQDNEEQDNEGRKAFMLGQQSGAAPRETGEPVPTIAGAGAISLVKPVILLYYTQSDCSDTESPLPSITAQGRKHALVKPVIVQYYSQGGCSDPERPLPAVTTKDRHGICNPTLVQVNHGDNSEEGDNRAQSDEDPLPTITAKRNVGLAQPTLVQIDHGAEYDGDDRRAKSVEDPLPTLTTKANLGLVQPLLVQTGQTGGNGSYSRDTEQPLPTITTNNDIHLVEPQAQPFLVPSFGERGGQEPRTHDVDEPTPAVTSRGAGSLVLPEATVTHLEEMLSRGTDPRRIILVNGTPHILDIRFRMLQNKELARAMGFDDDESQYEFTGTVSQVTKQIGNAVPVHLAAALVKAILGDDK